MDLYIYIYINPYILNTYLISTNPFVPNAPFL